jgi:hypothetical protein
MKKNPRAQKKVFCSARSETPLEMQTAVKAEQKIKKEIKT